MPLYDPAPILAAIAGVKASVDALPTQTPPVDLQPIADAVADLQADVTAKGAPAP